VVAVKLALILGVAPVKLLGQHSHGAAAAAAQLPLLSASQRRLLIRQGAPPCCTLTTRSRCGPGFGSWARKLDKDLLEQCTRYNLVGIAVVCLHCKRMCAKQSSGVCFLNSSFEIIGLFRERIVDRISLRCADLKSCTFMCFNSSYLCIYFGR